MNCLSSLLRVTTRPAKFQYLCRSSQCTISRTITPRPFHCALHYSTRFFQSSVPKEPSDPLHVLFCGSDEFSCASLKALYHEHVDNPDLIRSIEVVVRPGKRTGREMKIRDPPVRTVADTLGLKIHTRDTFTGWDMPTQTNIIIVVSFGLFVPARLLRAAKYGGLNLHPSLLPDLRGPAPLHHTVLNNYKVTGVSLQTLDHNAFDCGVVLAQARLKRKLPDYIITTSYLQSLITPAATRLLINGLQKNVHVPPLEFKGWVPPPGYPLRHAPKITKQDRQLTRALLLEFTSKGPPTPERLSHTLLTRRQAALGPLWFLSRDRYGKQKRIIIEAVDDQFPEPPNQEDYEDIDVSMLEGSPWNIPDILVPTTAELGPWQFVIPFEEKLEGGAQPQTQENGSPGEDITPKNLMFWAPYESSRGLKSAFPAGDDDALYLGKYRIVSLKVEGHGARPTRHALHSFIINTEEWRTYHERRDYLEKLREKAEPDNSNSGTLK